MLHDKSIYNLTEARELRGMSVAELSDKINVSRQAIYKYESGLLNPSPETMQSICDVLQLPPMFFHEPVVESSLSNRPIFFRSMKSSLQKSRKRIERWLQLLYKQIGFYEEYLDLPQVNLPDTGDICYEELKPADIDVIASDVRRFWGLGDSPISNVTLLLENNGIMISHVKLDSPELDACSVVYNGRPYILINKDKYTCSRVLANLAHELGHIVLHSGIDKSIIANKNNLNLIEDQAWRFATSFLMPPDSFIKEAQYITLDRLKALKHRWRISIAMMIMYSHDIGLIDSAKKEYLFREYSRRGYRKHEPLDTELAIETPSILFDCHNLLLRNHVFNEGELIASSVLLSDDYYDIINAPDEHRNKLHQKPKLKLLIS